MAASTAVWLVAGRLGWAYPAVRRFKSRGRFAQCMSEVAVPMEVVLAA
jgi:hypothetical protein